MAPRIGTKPLLLGTLLTLPLGAGCAWPFSQTTRSAPDAASTAGADATPGPDGTGDRWLDAAQTSIRRGDTGRALREFARAIEINPTLVTAHMGMADLYRMEGDFSRAEEGYRSAAAIEPRNFDAQYYHGLMLHLLGRLTESIGAYLRALEVRPDDEQANLNIATAYYQLAEYAQALPFAERAVRLSPRSGPARFNLGAIYAGLGRHGDAVVEYQQATELMPLSGRLLLNLAESYNQLRRYTEMRNTLLQLVRTEPSPAAYERLGFASFRLGESDETMFKAAAEAFGKAIEMDGDYFPALNGLGIIELNNYVWSGKEDLSARDRAMGHLRRSLQINRAQPRIEELITRYAQ